jgi:hypothetical protein
MPKRSTIQRDPLVDSPAVHTGEPPAAPPATAPPGAGLHDAREVSPRRRDTVERRAARRPDGAHAERARRAAGGRLELLGGNLGIGVASIRRFGAERRIGFVSPAEEFIDVESEVESVAIQPDREEHRLLSATGWAWGVGTFLGAAGIVLGAGLRLLHPRRMILQIALRDGRTLVARTDSVTADALAALAGTAASDDVATADAKVEARG